MVCGGIKCGNAMDIKSGPPPWFCPLNVFRPGSEGDFGQKVHGLILIRTANRLLFFSAGRLLVILKSAEGKLQEDGHLASHYPPRVEQDCLAAFFTFDRSFAPKVPIFGRAKICNFVDLIPSDWQGEEDPIKRLIHQKRVRRHFMSDMILAGWQFGRFMFRAVWGSIGGPGMPQRPDKRNCLEDHTQKQSQ